MANPFGGSDQTLSKNGSHPQQGSLVGAMIPRSASKIVEVISSTTITPTTGTYNADGYFFGASGTNEAQTAVMSPSLQSAGSVTVIVGLLYNSGGASSGLGQGFGLTSSGSVAEVRLYGDRYSRRVNVSHYDPNSIAPTMGNAFVSPSGDTFAAAYATSAGAQKGFIRIGTTTTNTSPATSSDTLTGGADLNTFRITLATQYGFQYVFIYNAFLTTPQIEAIMDDPGSVLSQSGGGGGGGPLKLAVLTRPVFGF